MSNRIVRRKPLGTSVILDSVIMEPDLKNHSRLITLFMIMSIVAVTVLAYAGSTRTGYMGMDGLTLIKSARISSPQDFNRLLTEPMMSDVQFGALFYRPVSSLSYSLDYAIWGANPDGYIITNLLIHIVTAIAAFFLARQLVPDRPLVPLITGIVFATHYTGLENIIEPAGRQDLLPVMLLMLSLLLFLKSRTSAYAILVGVVAVIVYLLALAAKEIAVIMPALVFTYVALFPGERDVRVFQRLKAAVLVTLPYALVTIVAFAWRSSIVGGLGGYGTSTSLPATLQLWFRTITQYFVYLFTPIEPLNAFFAPQPTDTQRAVSVIAILFILAGVFVFRRSLIRVITSQPSRWRRSAAALAMIILLVSTLGLFAYPFMAASLNHAVDAATTGDQSSLFSRSAESLNTLPPDYFYVRTRDLIVSTLLFALLLASLGLGLLQQPIPNISRLLESRPVRLILLLSVWLVVPLGVYLVTHVFAPRTWYVAAFPAGLLLALLVTNAYRELRRHRAGSDHAAGFAMFARPQAALFTLCALLLVLQIGSSVTRSYAAWATSSLMTEEFMQAISDAVENLPRDAVLHIQGVPVYDGILSVANYGIKTWLDTAYPANQLQVRIESYAFLASCINAFDTQVTTSQPGEWTVQVISASDSPNSCNLGERSSLVALGG